MRHFPWKEIGYAVGFVVLLAVLYVGAYYALVTRTESLRGFIPVYRFGGDAAVTFFGLSHDFDKAVRPEFWKLQFE